MNDVRICDDHEDDYPVPLIWTFAFNGAEYWCPYCGANRGMLGAGELVTDEDGTLRKRLHNYKKISRKFLRAKGRQVCARTRYKGEMIKPRELPEESRQADINRIKRYKYNRKVEDITQP